MSELGDPPSAPPGPPADVELVPPKPSTSDWPAQAANSIVDLVDQVRTKTTGPAITVARGLVFGVIVCAVVAVAGSAMRGRRIIAPPSGLATA